MSYVFEDEEEIQKHFSFKSTLKRLFVPCMVVSIVVVFFLLLVGDISQHAYARINSGTLDILGTLVVRTLANGFWGGLLLLVVWAPMYWYIFLRSRIPHELRALNIRTEERRIATETLDLLKNLMSEQSRQFDRLAELQGTVIRFGKDSLYSKE